MYKHNKPSYYQEEEKSSKSVKFLKEQKKQVEKTESFTETVQTWWTNLKYKVSSSFHSDQPQIQQNKDITILGKRYKNRKEAKNAIQKIFWFTYRNKLNIKNQFSSDVGWGCLVRVGQMAIASGLQRYLKNTGQFGKAQQLNIIYACLDQEGKQEKYSLNKFVGEAQKQLNHKVGQWFDLSKICYMLSKLHNKNPMKGTEGLKIVYFDQILQLKTVLNIEDIRTCTCTRPRIKCDKCYQILAEQANFQSFQYEKIKNDSFKGQFMKKKTKPQPNYQQKGKISLASKTVNYMEPFFKKNFPKDLVVIIVSQVSFGQNSQQREAARNAIFTLLNLDISLGILTGFPKKAIYVIGRQQQELIYLDPHFVQKNVSKNMNFGDIDSFFCKDYNKTQPQKLDTSMAFSFYIKCMNDLDSLYKTINQVNLRFNGRMAIGCDWKHSTFDQQQFAQYDNDDRLSEMSFFAP